MENDKYVVQAWTARTDSDKFRNVYRGTKQECLDYCRKVFIDAAIKLANVDQNEYEVSLGFDTNCLNMRVTEISLYGRGLYNGMNYTRYYSIEHSRWA